MNHVEYLTAALALAGVVALAARAARALSGSGAAAAAVVGACALVAGWAWAVLLLAYFVAATLLTRFRARDRMARTGGRLDKPGPRDAAQVLANGGVFAMAAFGYWLAPDPSWQAIGAGALAASAADTWATEVGTLARATPHSILDWRPVAPGTSGGVTGAGLSAGLAGAAFVAGIAAAVRWPGMASVAALVGGVFGCLLDSLIGASLQARRWCTSCDTVTEQRTHACGSPTEVRGGWPWLDNDGVNAVSTLAGALMGATATRYL